MNIICFLKGHKYADRYRDYPTHDIKGMNLIPLQWVIEDYCQRCGATDNQLDDFTIWSFIHFNCPQIKKKIKYWWR